MVAVKTAVSPIEANATDAGATTNDMASGAAGPSSQEASAAVNSVAAQRRAIRLPIPIP